MFPLMKPHQRKEAHSIFLNARIVFPLRIIFMSISHYRVSSPKSTFYLYESLLYNHDEKI